MNYIIYRYIQYQYNYNFYNYPSNKQVQADYFVNTTKCRMPGSSAFVSPSTKPTWCENQWPEQQRKMYHSLDELSFNRESNLMKMSPLKTGQNQHSHLLRITRRPNLGGEEVLQNPLHRHESGFVPIHWIPHSWNKEIVTKAHRFNLMNCNPPWKRDTDTSNCWNWDLLHHCIRTIEGFNKTTHCWIGVIQHGAVTPWRNHVEGG